MNTRKRFVDRLKSAGACKHALRWVGNKTLRQAWNRCGIGAWMFWLVDLLHGGGWLRVDFELIERSACLPSEIRKAIPFEELQDAWRRRCRFIDELDRRRRTVKQ